MLDQQSKILHGKHMVSDMQLSFGQLLENKKYNENIICRKYGWAE